MDLKNVYAIEFFSGSKTVTNFIKSNGGKCLSLDFNSALLPDICEDYLTFNVMGLPYKPNFIWFSPDCTYFSRLSHSLDWDKKTLKYRRYDYSPITTGAAKASDIITKIFYDLEILNPEYFVIENPVGRLRHMKQIRNAGVFRYSVNYKDWGFDYSKETDLFTNFMLPFSSSVPLRIGKSLTSIHGSYNRSMVPVQLISFILKYING